MHSEPDGEGPDMRTVYGIRTCDACRRALLVRERTLIRRPAAESPDGAVFIGPDALLQRVDSKR